MSIPKVLTAAAGGLLVATKLKDAHTYGAMKGNVYAQTGDAEALTKDYLNLQTQGEPNALANGAKKWWFKTDMSWNIRQPFNFIGGYVKGLGTMLVNNVVPVALGAGALISLKSTGAEKAAKAAFKTAKQALKAGTGTKPAVDAAKAAIKTAASRPVKFARAGLGIACAAWLVGTIITAIAGDSHKNSLENKYSYK